MTSLRVVQVIRAVAQHHGLSVKDILGSGRFRHISWPRQEAMWLAREVAGMSLPQIGAAMGGRHHSTVMQGIRAVEGRCARDPRLASRMQAMRAQFDAAPAGGAP